MPDLSTASSLTPYGVVLLVVGTVGVMLARGKLWTSGQVDRVLAKYDEIIAMHKEAKEAAMERADVQGRDMLAMLTKVVAAVDAPSTAGRHKVAP